MDKEILVEDKQSKSPFTLDELDKLEQHFMYNDLDALRDWTQRAIRYYETQKNRLYRVLEKEQHMDEAILLKIKIIEVLQDHDTSISTITTQNSDKGGSK